MDSRGHSVITDMAVSITRYCHTDYMTVLNMNYRDVIILHDTLKDLIEQENKLRSQETEKAAKNGKR